MKFLYMCMLILASMLTPAFAISDEPTKVPNTKFALWLPDELTASSDEGEPDDSMFDSFKFESQQSYQVMSESELSANIIIFKLPKDHGLKMNEIIDKSAAELINGLTEDEDMEMKLDSKTASKFGAVEFRKLDLSLTIEKLKVSISAVIIGGDDEIIVLLGFFTDEKVEAAADWKKILDSMAYNDKKSEKYLPWDVKPEEPKNGMFLFR